MLINKSELRHSLAFEGAVLGSALAITAIQRVVKNGFPKAKRIKADRDQFGTRLFGII